MEATLSSNTKKAYDCGMELFPADSTANLLPRDGRVHYLGPLLVDAPAWMDRLMAETPWKPDTVVLFGRRFTTARKVAWYGDPGCAYTYSGVTRPPLPWTPLLTELKQFVEDRSGTLFNCCLLNLYHHGGEGMAWHSDDERELMPQGVIASLSLGAERRFLFRHKEDPQIKIAVQLESGSLLLMQGETQAHWQHSLPKSTKVTTPRINLTFRQMRR